MKYRHLLGENADLRRLWLGQVVSEIGDWLNNIAVPALTLELAGPQQAGRAVAIYAIARHLPLFLFGPLAGVVVDLVSRRRVMIIADVLRAGLVCGFLVAEELASLTIIYVVAAGLFAVSAFFNAAKRAALPIIVRRREAELLSANSLSASTTAATIAVGSALGGVAATLAGRTFVFALNATTFLVSAELIRRIQVRTSSGIERPPPSVIAGAAPARRNARKVVSRLLPQNLYRLGRKALQRTVLDIRGGWQYVRSDDVLTAIFVIGAGWGLGNGAARALYSIFAQRLGAGQVSFGTTRSTDFGISVLFVAMGIGGVIGAPLARRFNATAAGGRPDLRPDSRLGSQLGSRMGRSMILDGCGLMLFSIMPTLWSAAVVLVGREINFAIWWTAQQTIIMNRTADRYAGRVFAFYETLTTLMMVISMLASGLAADTYGIRRVTTTSGALIALSGMLWFVLQRRRGQHQGNECTDEPTPAENASS